MASYKVTLIRSRWEGSQLQVPGIVYSPSHQWKNFQKYYLQTSNDKCQDLIFFLVESTMRRRDSKYHRRPFAPSIKNNLSWQRCSKHWASTKKIIYLHPLPHEAKHFRYSDKTMRTKTEQTTALCKLMDLNQKIQIIPKLVCFLINHFSVFVVSYQPGNRLINLPP